ncbi:hypothetical protein ACFPVY_02255 [Flavobacterium qiangtangense]|uniref:Uncharacterized protein n=1 Tax=Flavobacterium qiangtangense TaxID=1442595 RepID=A0ABW1PIT5_9FLAO
MLCPPVFNGVGKLYGKEHEPLIVNPSHCLEHISSASKMHDAAQKLEAWHG